MDNDIETKEEQSQKEEKHGIYVHYHMWQFSSLICLKYEVGNIFIIPTI